MEDWQSPTCGDCFYFRHDGGTHGVCGHVVTADADRYRHEKSTCEHHSRMSQGDVEEGTGDRLSEADFASLVSQSHALATYGDYYRASLILEKVLRSLRPASFQS